MDKTPGIEAMKKKDYSSFACVDCSKKDELIEELKKALRNLADQFEFSKEDAQEYAVFRKAKQLLKP